MAAKTVVALVAATLIGVAVGVAGFTFVYAEGAAYLTNDPNACGNCHVMQEQLRGWERGSHRSVATCNDCHSPHTFFGKYSTKAINGWNHSVAFTLGGFHEPIRIGPRNRAVTEGACRSCHAELGAALDGAGDEQVSCIRCHSTVGHP